MKVIKKAGRSIVKKCSVFDVYQGEHVEEGYKSIAMQITFQDEKKTLKDEEINTSMEAILEAIKKNFDANLRG